jgi:hypothetical protein
MTRGVLKRSFWQCQAPNAPRFDLDDPLSAWRQEREHLKNAVVALPDGWELLSTDVTPAALQLKIHRNRGRISMNKWNIIYKCWCTNKNNGRIGI